MSLLKENNISRQTIDYYQDEILRKKNISDEDKKIIIDSRRKYRKFLMLEALIFFVSIRQIYKNTKPADFLSKLNVQTFRFCITSMIAMVLIYNFANNEYYMDNKFLLIKHLHVDEKRYNQSILNREIMKLYIQDSKI